MSRRSPAPIAGTLAGLVLGGSALTWGIASAEAAPSPAGANAAAFLARELAAGAGLLDYPGTDQPDPGVTQDAVLALAAGGLAGDQARRTTRAVVERLPEYLGPAYGPQELYAGPVAKTLLLAEVMGLDASAVGGRDLVADLAGLERADGRYGDRTAYTDTATYYTQAVGVLAMNRAASVPSGPVRYLLSGQCADGGFRLFDDGGACVANPDVTAMAVLALSATGDAPDAVDRAADYLTSRQSENGALPGGPGSEAVNSNSTALAAMAFAADARHEPAQRAQDFLRSLQFGCAAPESLRGAVAYDQGAYATLLAGGAGATPTDQERRATAQAALALAGADLGTLSIDGASPAAGSCQDTAEPGSTSTTSSTSTATPTPPSGTSTSPPSTTSTTPVTTATRTVTVTRIPATRTVTVTGTNAGPAGAGASRQESSTGGETGSDATDSNASGPSGTRSGGAGLGDPASAGAGAGTTSPPAAHPGTAARAASAEAVAVAPAGRQRWPWLAAAALIAAGAAAAFTILRGRAH